MSATLFSLVGAGLMVAVLYYQVVALRYFREHADAAVSRCLLDGRVRQGIAIVRTTAAVYAVTVFVAVAGQLAGVAALRWIVPVGVLLLLLGVLSCVRRVAYTAGVFNEREDDLAPVAEKIDPYIARLGSRRG